MNTATSANSTPLLRMTGMTKEFPGVRALQGVDLELQSGEVLALLGENGAGKSTLIKILAGAHVPTAGTIEINGTATTLMSPQQARAAGIAVIHQEFNLISALTVQENLFLGQEQSRWGWIRSQAERNRARALFDRIGLSIDPRMRCRDLTVAQQQVVEIARALSVDARIIVMDEPTAALSPREVAGLFRSLRELRTQGIGIIYVSHRLEEIFEIADRAVILRDGQHVSTHPVAELTRTQMIENMVGRRLDQEFPVRPQPLNLVNETGFKSPRENRLVVRNLSRGEAVRNVSFEIRRGEILGLTGLIGSGRTETARLIAGIDLPDRGRILLDDHPLCLHSPREAIAAGICLLTEDRKSQGLILNRSALENFSLPNLPRFASLGWIHRRRERMAFENYREQLNIKTTGPEQPARFLSGGNQQKIVLAKWLQRNADVIIFDEPTRGIDVGAKFEIYQLINQLAATGKAILLISSEFPEVLGMADRVLVMRDGKISGEIANPQQSTQARILELAVH